MKEIKFRAWDKDQKIMMECGWMGNAAFSCSMGDYTILEDRPDMPIMQFTGLNDKSEKEIWEGDILKLVAYKNIGKHSIRVVSFDKGCFGFVDMTGVFYPLGVKIGNKGNEKIFEVIGNIHQNPELLEVTK